MQPFFGTSDLVGCIHCGEQAVTECGLLPASGGAMPGCSSLERGARRLEVPERPQNSTEMNSGECRHACVAGGFCLSTASPRVAAPVS